jgi:hypothetical protein
VQGAAADDDVLRKWNTTINNWWGDAEVVHRPPPGPGAKDSKYRLRFEFEYTDDASKACAQICCVQTTGAAAAKNRKGTIDAIRWGAADTGPGGGICHEVGHFLGCPDEYFTIEYEGRTHNWGEGYTPGKGVMNNPDEKPLARHYRIVGQELARHCGFNPNEAWIILEIGLSLDHPSQRKHPLAGHIWDPPL